MASQTLMLLLKRRLILCSLGSRLNSLFNNFILHFLYIDIFIIIRKHYSKVKHRAPTYSRVLYFGHRLTKHLVLVVTRKAKVNWCSCHQAVELVTLWLRLRVRGHCMAIGALEKWKNCTNWCQVWYSADGRCGTFGPVCFIYKEGTGHYRM